MFRTSNKRVVIEMNEEILRIKIKLLEGLIYKLYNLEDLDDAEQAICLDIEKLIEGRGQE